MSKWQTYANFIEYVKSTDYVDLLESNKEILLLAFDLAGKLATPILHTPVAYFPSLNFAVSSLYSYRHLDFAGSWMFTHPVVSAPHWAQGFEDLRAFCREQQTHFLPSAFFFDWPDAIDKQQYAVSEHQTAVVNLDVQYNDSLKSKSRYKVQRALDRHSDKRFELSTEISRSTLEHFISQLHLRYSNSNHLASTVLQLTLAYASTRCGKLVYWLTCTAPGSKQPCAVQAFVKRRKGFVYQCMAIDTAKFLSGNLSRIGLACLANAVLSLQQEEATGILNLTHFTEWNNPTSNEYKEPAANAYLPVYTQAILGYPDQNFIGEAVQAY